MIVYICPVDEGFRSCVSKKALSAGQSSGTGCLLMPSGNYMTFITVVNVMLDKLRERLHTRLTDYMIFHPEKSPHTLPDP